jgi:ribosome-binding protein aMBF1 (putative translation factor)
MKKTKRKSTSKQSPDALSALKRRYVDGRRDRESMLAQVRADDAVGRKIYQLRVSAGLSQRQLADLVGTTASVICRLEDADYDGHSLGMLHRIARALNKESEITFVSKRRAA